MILDRCARELEAADVERRRTIAFGLGKRENRGIKRSLEPPVVLYCVAVLTTSDPAPFVSFSRSHRIALYISNCQLLHILPIEP